MLTKFKEEFFKILSMNESDLKSVSPDLGMTYVAMLVDSNIEFKDHSEGEEKKIEVLIKTATARATSTVTSSPEAFKAIKGLLLRSFPGLVITYRVMQEEPAEKEEKKEAVRPKRPPVAPSKVTGRYLAKSMTFDNFIVGEANEEAFNACRRVASAPKASKNVLLLYSKPALGKTHLASAVANYVNDHVPGCRGYFFKKNDFIGSILSSRGKEKRVSEYVEELISADLVVFDDVQMLFDRTVPFALDIFYEMIDSRITLDRPVTTIFTADKLLSDYKIEIPRGDLEKEAGLRLHFEYMEEEQDSERRLYKTVAPRITSRMESGRTLALDNPTPKMKETFMLNYFDSESISIDLPAMDQIRFIATNGPTNFRDLRSVCERVKDAVLEQLDVSKALDTITEGFGGSKGDVQKSYINNTIQEIVQFFGINSEEMNKKRIRNAQVTFVRDTIFYILANHLKMSQSAISEVFKLSKGAVSIRLNEYERGLDDPEQKDVLLRLLKKLGLVERAGNND